MEYHATHSHMAGALSDDRCSIQYVSIHSKTEQISLYFTIE